MANIPGTNSGETLTGTIFADTIDGKGGDDVIRGKSGADSIRGGTGVDKMFGDGGDDTFLISASEAAAGEIYDGGGDVDTLQVSNGVDFSSITLTSIEKLTFNSGVGGGFVVLLGAASIGGSGLSGNLAITGGGGRDTVQVAMLTATSVDLSGFTYVNWEPDDRIVVLGDSTSESFKGSWAADLIDPDLGVDTVLAGGGDDTIDANRTQAGDLYNGGTGLDTLQVSDDGVTDLTGATLISIEALLFGFNLASDFMEARLSASQFASGKVSSSLFVRSQDTDSELLRIVMGGETVFSAANFAFTGFSATDSVVIEGSAGNDSITGSSVNDALLGRGGQDVLLGGAGDDTLDGGAGNDFMFGGAGNDVYKVAQGGDVAAEVLVGPDPGGKDRVVAEVDATLSQFIEQLDLAGTADLDGTGNALANVIRGNSGDNVLRGLDGADRLIGGLGQDQLFGGVGNDRFAFTDIADSVVGNLRDEIRDFAGSDLVDLAAIDADEIVAGNQAFVLDLDGSFSTGEIRLNVNGSNTIVSLNTDVDANADMQIAVIGVTNLTAASFIL